MGILNRKKKLKNEQNQLTKDATNPRKFKVRCNGCEHDFELRAEDVISTKVGPEVTWSYFECPECHRRYTTFIGDSYVNKYIKKRNELKREIQTELNKGDQMNVQKYHELMRKDENAATKIAARSVKLKQEYDINGKEQERVFQ